MEEKNQSIVGLCVRIAEYSGIYLPRARSPLFKKLYRVYTSLLGFFHLSILLLEIVLLIVCVTTGDFEKFINCIFIACTGVTICLKFMTCFFCNNEIDELIVTATTGKFRPRNKAEKEIQFHYEKFLR